MCAGVAGNDGYDPDELIALSRLPRPEVDAAVRLRQVARHVASSHRRLLARD